jgi:hypothetical protein
LVGCRGISWANMGVKGIQGVSTVISWIFDGFVANSHPPSTIGLAASSQIPVLFEFCNGANRWGNNQTACKPGSVRADRRGTAIPLGRALRRASRDQPGRQGGNTHGATAPAAPIRSCSRWGLPCRRRCRRRGTLLPHHFTLARGPFGAQAVCFLWHCPWGRPRRPLAGTAFPWSPDFPPLTGRCLRAAAVRPSDISEIALRQRSVKLKLGSRTRRRHAHKKAPMPDRAPPGPTGRSRCVRLQPPLAFDTVPCRIDAGDLLGGAGDQLGRHATGGEAVGVMLAHQSLPGCPHLVAGRPACDTED